VDVPPAAVHIKDFSEQERAPVAQAWHESSELVSRIGLGDRRNRPGASTSDEECNSLRLSQRLRIDSELARKLLVEREQTRCGSRRGLPRLVKAGQLASERILECDQWGTGNRHLPRVGIANRGLSASRFTWG
jgi:hypothetical protein